MFGHSYFGSTPFAGFNASAAAVLTLAIAVSSGSIALSGDSSGSDALAPTQNVATIALGADAGSASVSLTPSFSATLSLVTEN